MTDYKTCNHLHDDGHTCDSPAAADATQPGQRRPKRPPKSHGQTWIAITSYGINKMRTISG